MPNKVIIHYGVKGMKWGVRRTPEELGKKTNVNSLEALLLTLGVTVLAAAGSAALSNVGNKKVGKIIENPDLKVTSLKDVKRIQPPESMLQSLRSTNNTNSFNKHYKNNCPNATMAYELRRRGYDVKAKPAKIGETMQSIRQSYKLKGVEVFNSIDNTNANMAVRKRNDQYLKDYFNSVPDGYRGAIQLAWKDMPGCGHIFNTEKVDGKIMFVDSQSGMFGEFKGYTSASNVLGDVAANFGATSFAKNPANYLSKAGRIEFFRLDTAEIDDKELENRIIKG